MTQVTLKYFEDGKEVSEQRTIKPMNVFQITSLSSQINQLFKDIKANEHLKNALDNIFKATDEVKRMNREIVESNRANGLETQQDEYFKVSDTIMSVGNELTENVLGSLSIVLDDAPKSVINLLSIASNIESDYLLAQDPYVFLDVFDAVVEENDIPKLVERLKKSKGSLQVVMNAVLPKKEKADKVTKLNK